MRVIYLTNLLNSALGDLVQSIVIQILPNFDYFRDCNYRYECMIYTQIRYLTQSIGNNIIATILYYVPFNVIFLFTMNYHNAMIIVLNHIT